MSWYLYTLSSPLSTSRNRIGVLGTLTPYYPVICWKVSVFIRAVCQHLATQGFGADMQAAAVTASPANSSSSVVEACYPPILSPYDRCPSWWGWAIISYKWLLYQIMLDLNLTIKIPISFSLSGLLIWSLASFSCLEYEWAFTNRDKVYSS